MPESYIALGALALSAAVSPWAPVFRLPLLGLPVLCALFVVAMLALAGHAIRGATRVTRVRGLAGGRRVLETGLIALLVLLQPLARLSGRICAGLTPWRRRKSPHGVGALVRVQSTWSERARSASEWLTLLEQQLRCAQAVVGSGGRHDRWDLSVRLGAMGGARVQLAIEEHGQGRQLLRWRVTARPARLPVAATAVLALIGVAEAGTAGAPVAFAAGVVVLVIVARMVLDCMTAATAVAMVLAGWVAPASAIPGCIAVAEPAAGFGGRVRLPAVLREVR